MVQEKVAITGNEAVALAMKQINPDVVAAYPITPQTEIVQIFYLCQQRSCRHRICHR